MIDRVKAFLITLTGFALALLPTGWLQACAPLPLCISFAYESYTYKPLAIADVLTSTTVPDIETVPTHVPVYQDWSRVIPVVTLYLSVALLADPASQVGFLALVTLVVLADYVSLVLRRARQILAFRERYPFLGRYEVWYRDELLQAGTPFLPPVPPPITPGFCWVSQFFPTVNLAKPSPADAQLLLQFFGPDCSWNYFANGWIPTRELVCYMEEFGQTTICLAKVSDSIYHIHTGPGGVPVSLDHVRNLPPCWFGMSPEFFSDSALKSAAYGLHIGDYANLLRASKEQCPYYVPEKMMHHLVDYGINPPAPLAERHSHPVHYAYRVRNRKAASYLLANQDWYGLFCSSRAVRDVQTTSGVNVPLDTFNPHYEAKDLSRWPSASAPATFAPSSKAPVWFIDDALHHLSNSAVGAWFDEHPTLRTVVATVVIPPETVFGLPALTPDLYNFETIHTPEGPRLMYIAENDNAGHYLQPVDAHRWLTATRLITPRNECLHVSMVHQIRAHAVIVISRPQHLVQTHRVQDLPPVTTISWFTHPTGNTYERLTTTSLLTSLVHYASRVTATNQRDLYSKVAQHASITYDKTNSSFIRAAVLEATTTRMLDFKTSPSRLDTVLMRLTYYVGLPFYSFTWLVHSTNSRLFGRRFDVPKIWYTDCHYLVSHPNDAPMPGLLAPVCCAHDVPFWFIPPSATVAARLAVFNASAVLWVVLKLLFLAAYKTFHIWFPQIPWYANHITYILNLNWNDTPVGLVFLLLGVWVGFRGPRVELYPAHKPIIRWVKRAYAMLFFLPCAGVRMPAGASTFYQLLLLFTFLFHEWPRMWPPFYYHEKIGSWESVHAHFLGVFWSCIGMLIITAGIIAWSRPYNELPHHVTVEEVKESGSPVYFDDDLSSWHPSDVDSRPPTRPPSIKAPSPPVRPPPLRRQIPVVPQRPHVARYVPEDVPLRDMNPPRPITPPPGPDPLVRYRHMPSGFDLRTFSALLTTHTGVPPMAPTPGRDCVWICLGAALGMPPAVLFCNWMAMQTTTYIQRHIDGGVPREELPQVFAHFGLGVTLREARINGHACPRGNGLQPRMPSYNPQNPPLSVQPPTPGWPAVTFYITSAADGQFHLVDNAQPATNIGVPTAHATAIVGYASRSVPRVEIMDVLNVPVRVYGQAYARLQGALLNAAAAMHGEFNNLAQYRAAYAPLPAVPVRAQVVPYRLSLADAQLARNLAQDCKNHPEAMDLRANAENTAIALNTLCKRSLESIRAGTYNTRPTNLHFLAGAGGSGKTFELLRYLPQIAPAGGFNVANLRFHTWFSALRTTLERAVTPQYPFLRSTNFSTGTMCLAQPLPGVLVLDDATMLWPGFIPLLIATNPEITDIVITFDATQGRVTFPHADSASREDISTAEWLSAISENYATLIRRYSVDICNLFGLPVVEPEPGQPVREGKVYITSQAPHDVPLLVVSPRFAETQNAGGQRCLTFTACQGKTIDGDVAIDLGGLTATATDENVWTALTRATGNVFLVLGSNSPRSSQLVESLYGKSQILSAMLAVAARNQTAVLTAQDDPDHLIARAVHNHLARNLSPAACATLGLPVASPIVGYVKEQYRSQWLITERTDVGDFYTARTKRGAMTKATTNRPAFSKDVPRVEHRADAIRELLQLYTPVPNDSRIEANSTDYQLPPPVGFEGEFDPIFSHDEPVNVETREKCAPGTRMYTQQHVHDGPNAILRHHASDKATQLISEAKRIVIGQDTESLNSSEKARLKQLKRGFGKFFDVDSWNSAPLDSGLMEQAACEFLGPWVSKRTIRGIKTSLSKDDLDQLPNWVKLFLKTQYVKKEEKRFADATAGQIVSEFPLAKQFRDAQFALYVEKLALKHAFPSTYLHSRASPDDMSRWYQEHWKPGLITANDYTSWDQGCDKVFAHFACWVMTLCKVPSEYISDYLYDRINVRSYLGPHRTKQESGDRWTWLINTLGNAAITGASLNCPKRTTAAFSGDDGAVLGSWRYQSDFKPAHWKMTPKRTVEYESVFCGYHLGLSDIYMDPVVILHRAQNGLALGRNDAEYWNSISDALREVGARVDSHNLHLKAAEHFLTRARQIFALA